MEVLTMSEDTRACPFCGEQILAVAIKCKHCGSNIDAKPSPPQIRDIKAPTDHPTGSMADKMQNPAVAKCKRCGNDVAKNVATCPKCGARLRLRLRVKVIAGVAIFLVARCAVVSAWDKHDQNVYWAEKAGKAAAAAARWQAVEQEQKAAEAARQAVERAKQAEQEDAKSALARTSPARVAQSAARQERFPEIVARFIKMNKLKQNAFAAEFHGTVLSGSGKVFEVADCGWTDDSEKWGQNCLKVTLDNGNPRVVLYFGEKDEAQIASYDKGKAMRFSDCVGISIKDWGFWSTATCDMP
jgi:DNA-directed RNA polymerase subunit RPC12/RpoP